MVSLTDFDDAEFPMPTGRKPRTKAVRETEKRARDRDAHDVQFIAVDGEGETRMYEDFWDEEEGNWNQRRIDQDSTETRHEVQDYVLLSVGDDSYHENGQHLHYTKVFEFLYKKFEENPHAAFVGFSLGYDFAQWFKTMDEDVVWKLMHKKGILTRMPTNEDNKYPWPVTDGYKEWNSSTSYNRIAGSWEFDILGDKRFKLRPHVPKDRYPQCEVNHKTKELIEECFSGVHNKHPFKWMYICDVFPFFQSSFLKVIDPNPKDRILNDIRTWVYDEDFPDRYNPNYDPTTHPNYTPENHPNRLVNDADYLTLIVGKHDRSTAILGEKMIEYNKLENKVLANVMSKLNHGFVADGIKMGIKQWMGPGQAAQLWMANIGVPTGAEVREAIKDKFIMDAAKASYYGGWFEIFSHGPIPGTVYNYDINSAYPAVIAKLPCLIHGHWKKGIRATLAPLPDNKMRLLEVTVKGDDPFIGPLPFRAPNGNILRPLNVRGWYWQHEIEASKKAGLIKTIKIHQYIEYTKPECECATPMASIKDLYFGRIDPSKGKDFKNSPQGKAKKLVYNSAYGKLAQSIGEPRFSNSIYASLITAGCRTMILESIASHPQKSKGVLMIATDGIVFKTPHKKLALSKTELGLWDEDEYENLSLFMPGLYWHDKAREAIRNGSTPELKSRGVSPKYLASMIDEIDEGWRNCIDYFGENEYPMKMINIDWAITGAKEAINSNDWGKCARVTRNAKRVVNGNPHNKRDRVYEDKYTGGLRSHPYEYYVARQNFKELGIRKGDKVIATLPYEPTFGDDRAWEGDDTDNLLTRDGYIMNILSERLGNR